MLETQKTMEPAGTAGGRPWWKVEARWWVLLVVGSGTLMSALDSSIVNVALPAIGNATRAPLATLEWVVLSYLLAVSSTLLVFGRMADLHGRRRIYLAGQVCFALGSLFCGLSGRIGPLIASRAFQGLGASMVFALSPVVLIGAFPAEERGRALGLQATMTYLGMSIGPGLGGWLAEHFGWSSVFLVNVPIGVAMIALSLRVLPHDAARSRETSAPFDVTGSVLLAAAMGSLLLAASQGPGLGWGNPLVLGLFAVTAICAAAFLHLERRLEHPVLDVSLFSRWTFSASTLAAFLCYSATAAVNFSAPFLLIRACGFPASRAGLALMAVPVGMLMLTAAAGYLSDRVGVRLPATLGMLLLSVGGLLLLAVRPGCGLRAFLPGALAIGMGSGLFTAPNNSAIMGAAPLQRRGVAGAILAAARTTGFATGTALAGVIYEIRLHALHSSAPYAIAAGAHTCFIAVSALGLAAAMLSMTRR